MRCSPPWNGLFSARLNQSHKCRCEIFANNKQTTTEAALPFCSENGVAAERTRRVASRGDHRAWLSAADQ